MRFIGEEKLISGGWRDYGLVIGGVGWVDGDVWFFLCFAFKADVVGRSQSCCAREWVD